MFGADELRSRVQPEMLLGALARITIGGCRSRDIFFPLGGSFSASLLLLLEGRINGSSSAESGGLEESHANSLVGLFSKSPVLPKFRRFSIFLLISRL